MDIFGTEINLDGAAIGAASFSLIIISRWLTIKLEYYFTKRFWIVFLLWGLGLIALSLYTINDTLSTIYGIAGYMFLWGIGEIIEQEERVAKGWFPTNKKRIDRSKK